MCCVLLFQPRFSHISHTIIWPATLGLAALLFVSLAAMSTSSILLTICSSFVLVIWNFDLSRFSLLILDAYTTLVSLMAHCNYCTHLQSFVGTHAFRFRQQSKHFSYSCDGPIQTKFRAEDHWSHVNFQRLSK